MFHFPISYDEPLFRPPSEAYSLIFQATIGCSWNRCAFCDMYTSKKFRIKNPADLKAEIAKLAKAFPEARKVFLGDGNAMILSFNKLKDILLALKNAFPKLRRVSCYASARDLQNKSLNELAELEALGLKLLYVGIESGSDKVLKSINKGETSEVFSEQLNKARKAGIGLSVMILNGIGGQELSEEHVKESANLANLIQPEYVSTLVLSFPNGIDHFRNRINRTFTALNPMELLMELKQFIDFTDLNQTVFRSDHASNYLSLKGILGSDKDLLIQKITNACNHPNFFRKEWERGL